MKKMLAIAFALVFVLGLLVGCSTPENDEAIGYIEVCNTESYYPIFFSLPTDVFNFSLGKYVNIYTAYNGNICKFYNSGELRTTYENTYAFSAPYYFDEYIYAMSTDGCLYKIQNNSGEMSAVSEKMDGYAANCIAVNDDFALLTMHTANDSDKFLIKLMRVDLATGKATELSLGTDHRIYCSAGGVMYVYTKEVIDREEAWSLYEIPTDGEPIYICDMTDIGSTPRFVLEEGMFYFADEMGALCAKSLITGKTVICRVDAGIYPAGDYNESGMVFYQGNIVFYNYNTGCIESLYTPDFGLSEKKVVTIASPNNQSVAHINLEKLSAVSDISVNYITLTENEMTLKIMAGDDDVDIYLIPDTLARSLLKKNIYTPIESDIVRDFNASCFDYINEFCFAENGDIALMPLTSFIHAVIYPLSSVEEVGFTKDDLLYYDSFMELARNHGSDRVPFQSGEVIYFDMHAQYANYYCDFENGEFDFTTDLYKSFYSELLTYIDFNHYEATDHEVLKHPSCYVDERHPEAVWPYDAPDNYSDITLFSTGLFEYYWHAQDCDDFFEEWGAAPIPRISEQVTANCVEVEFAYINPYSNNKDVATLTLEALARNHMSLRSGQTVYTFLLKDKSAYSSDYHPESQVFNDFHAIASEGFIFGYSMDYTHRNDKEQFGRGLISVDEATQMLQREVEIWLNE